MSAIFGLVHPGGAAVIGEALARMEARLAPFGTRSGDAFLEGTVGLGHRSRPFTPEDAGERQPYCADGLTIVFDGRIDDRKALAERIGIPARIAASIPDCVLALRAFRLWGDDSPRHIVGPFAFAVWDAGRQRLFAARSRLGGRMLFFQHAADRLAFATSPEGVAAALIAPRMLDEDKMARSLVGVPARPEQTFFKGVERLLPGHCVTADADGVRIRRYWVPDPGREIRFSRDADYVDAFLSLYDSVVADHLRGASPVGVMLSGGLDSASIAATARGLMPQGARLLSYTQVPDSAAAWPAPQGYYSDETALVARIAAMHAGIEPSFIDSNGEGPFDGCDALFSLTGAPYRAVVNRAWYEAAIVAARSAGARVVLTGEQGNLTISWSGAGLIAEALHGRGDRSFLAEAGSAIGSGRGLQLVRALIGHVLPDGAMRGVRRRRDLPETAERTRYSPAHPGLLAAYAREIAAPGPDAGPQWSPAARHAALVGPDMNGTCLAAYRALYDVDVRLPLMDQRLVDFSLALPESQQRRGSVSRWLIRRAMTGRLPAEVLNNRQRGLQATDWLATLQANRETMRAALIRAEADPVASHMLDLPRLRQLLDAIPQRGAVTGSAARLYRDTLPRGVMAAQYLCWFSAGGR